MKSFPMIYRADIQILRGLSVLAVLFFHMQVPGFKNGFLGVDIFFVLSGFLMAVLYDPTKKKLFFIRRLKRLVPAYLATVLISLLAAVILVTPNEMPSVEWQAISAMLLGPNMWFWSENSYFSKAAFTPLLHLWSLGVEFQFYLIVPVLFWMFAKARILLPLGILASLFLCGMALEISPKTAFFMLPFRLWEFLAGYAAAVYGTERGAIKHPQIRWLGLVGLVMMPLLLFIPMSPEASDFFTGHPGFTSIAAVTATSLILAFGLPKSLELSTPAKAMEALGKYSYSLYLVHFPVIVFMLYEPFEGTIMQPSGIGEVVLVSLTIIVLTGMLHHIVEEPFRKTASLKRWMAAPVLAIAMLIALGSSLQNLRFTEQEQLIFGAWYDRSEYRCGKAVRLMDPWAVSCDLTPLIEQPERAVLFVGNSHADSLKSTFTEVASSMNTKVYFIVQNMPLMKGGLSPTQIIAEATKHRADMIVLHYSPDSVEPEKITETAALAEKSKIKTAYIAPVPVWSEHIPKALWLNSKDKAKLPVQELSDYQQKNKSFLNQISAANSYNFKLFETAQAFCKPHCELESKEGRPLYFDKSHLTLTGSGRLREIFRDIIEFSRR